MIAAGFESLLLFLAFILISGMSTWLQKRRQADDERDPGPDLSRGRGPSRPGTPQSPPVLPRRATPAALQNWEEELRRLLDGDRGQPTPPPPRAAPARLAGSSSRPQPAPQPARRVPVPARRTSQAEDAVSRVAKLEDSERAYQHARQLQQEAAARLREAQAKTVRHRGGYQARDRRVRSDDIRAARALLSRPRYARQAVIASVILGQPRGLE